jgi:hypothetical protein
VARATARTKPAWRRLLANELVIFGSHWHRGAGRCCNDHTMRLAGRNHCDRPHFR